MCAVSYILYHNSRKELVKIIELCAQLSGVIPGVPNRRDEPSPVRLTKQNTKM